MQNNPQWTKELERTASIISKALLEKTIKWGVAVSTYDGKHVVSYSGFKNYFAIWFYNGVFIKDKKRSDINQEALKKLINETIHF